MTDLYRIGFLVVWEGLSRRAQETGLDATQVLGSHAVRVWWVHDRVCSAMEDAYRVRLRQLQESSGERARALIDALNGLPDTREAAERATRAVGFRPDAHFVTAVVSGEDGRRPYLPSTVTVDDGGETLVLGSVRTSGPESVDRLTGDLLRLGWSHVGVGLCLTGLDGARRSLRQARRAHRAARETGQQMLSAGPDWFACMVGNEVEHLAPVLGSVTELLAQDPDLAATVSAYLSADRNLTHAATKLFLHPNTVAYRVRRLAETTGLDLRTLDGLVQAYTALTLLGCPPEG